MFFSRDNTGYEEIGQHIQILEHNVTTDQVNSSNEEISTENSSIYTIYGYQRTKLRLFVYHFFGIILIGIPYLLVHWFKSLIILKYRKCNLDACDVILVTNDQGNPTIIKVILISNHFKDDDDDEHIIINDHLENYETKKLFIYEHVRYIWNSSIDKFIRVKSLEENNTVVGIVEDRSGISREDRQELLELYGPNLVQIELKSYFELFKEEIVNPFYLFQLFSITLWCLDDYFYYAGCVLFLSALSIFTSLWETKKQSLTLHELVERSKPDKVLIKDSKSDEIIEISPDLLVPGDILVLPPNGYIMPCDAVLLTGSCIVNESMLTGESVPVTKTPPSIDDEQFSFTTMKRHLLFSGTVVVQTRFLNNEKILAKVLRTGFNTSKGELIKSILFPQPIGFQFYKDSIKFVVALFCVALLGMAYCVRLYITREAAIATILIRTLDIITIIVPPALPMAMTAGTIYSQSRLKKLGIYCISPPRINVCGKIKLVCFDKTGTLTDDGLTMHGVIEVRDKKMTSEIKDPRRLNMYSELIQGLATCHSITTIHGELCGDPLDIEMFKSTDWTLIEAGEEHIRFDSLAPTIVRPKADPTSGTLIGDISITSGDVPYLIGIIKQHQFSSEKQCMSIIARVLGHRNMKVFTKGSPEKIHSLSRPETIPDNFYEILNDFTSKGYRVIALGFRELSSKVKLKDVEKIKREELEQNLTFLGFLIMLNSLKPETKPIIEDLAAASIRTVMITGDNIMTAISVARECRMVLPDEEILIIKTDGKKLSLELSGRQEIDLQEDVTILNMQPWRYHLAMDGRTWSTIKKFYPEILPKILARGTIFARFGPDQKSQLVMSLQQLDYIVAMCGDGANDCGALKAAHIGISLSEAEASVAAPFTSKLQNISCVKHLALEGRCALVTSFGIFKYMTLYSLIQFCTILILYSKCSILGNMQFLYIDLIITASLAFTMGRQGPGEILVPKRPMSSLISLANVIPLLFQVVLCSVVQILVLFFLLGQDWYRPSITLIYNLECRRASSTALVESEENVLSWENTVVFVTSCFQYLILGAVYSKGRPYRQPLYTNYLLISILVALTGFTVMLLIHPYEPIAKFFEIQPYSADNSNENIFRAWLLLFPAIHLIISVMIENLIAERIWFKRLIHFLTRKSKPKNKFKIIEKELEFNGNWLEIVNGTRRSQTERAFS